MSRSTVKPLAQPSRKAATSGSPDTSATGTLLPTLSERLVLIRAGDPDLPAPTAPADQAAKLLPKLGKALRRPGIARERVFNATKGAVYAYAIDPSNPQRVIRESADGTKVVGRWVGGRFRPSPVGVPTKRKA